MVSEPLPVCSGDRRVASSLQRGECRQGGEEKESSMSAGGGLKVAVRPAVMVGDERERAERVTLMNPHLAGVRSLLSASSTPMFCCPDSLGSFT